MQFASRHLLITFWCNLVRSTPDILKNLQSKDNRTQQCLVILEITSSKDNQAQKRQKTAPDGPASIANAKQMAQLP